MNHDEIVRMSDHQTYNTFMDPGAAVDVSSNSDEDFNPGTLECCSFDSMTLYNRENGNELKFEEENFDTARIFKQNQDGDTQLHLAIIYKKTDLAFKFISQAPTYKHLSLPNGLFQTPLHLAVITDQPEVVRSLVVAGADVTLRDKKGNTALNIACLNGKLDVLISLLESERVNDRRYYGYDILNQRNQQVFSVKNYDGLTCFHLAAMNGYLNVLDVLIRNNIDINMKEGKSGRTVLHIACESGDTNLVKFLLSYGACDTNTRTFDSSTPFDLARARGHEDVCRTLAAAGAGTR